MIRAISSPSSSTTGWATLIFAINSSSHRAAPRAGQASQLPENKDRRNARQAEGTTRGQAGLPPAISLDGGSEEFRIDVSGLSPLYRKGRHQGRYRRDHLQQASCLRPRKDLGYNVVQKSAQRRPVTCDIDDEDRLVMKLELLPADDFENFVERSDAARQKREGVGLLGHQPLAFVHAVDDDKFGHAVMSQFGIPKPRRDDPGHNAAGHQHRVSQKTHEPDPPAAIHQPDPRSGETRSELARRF